MYATAPEPSTVKTKKEPHCLGLLNNYPDTEETRILLTPEACGLLSSMGMKVLVEPDTGLDISYTDEDYAAAGAEITPRTEILCRAHTILSTRMLSEADTDKLQTGATLLCLWAPEMSSKLLHTLLDKEITTMALDHIYSHNGLPTIARTLDEIDGRAAILYAQEGLSFLGEGKGVLLSGIPGIKPCEILIIGAGARPQSAALAALQAGARVTLMDNDVSELYQATAHCGPHLVTAAIHPKVLANTVKRADVIILDSCTREFQFPKALSVALKNSVYFLDLSESTPSLIVPRTVAQACSNILVHLLGETLSLGGIDRQILQLPGVQAGVVTYRGHLIDKHLAMRHGMHAIDLELLLGGRN